MERQVLVRHVPDGTLVAHQALEQRPDVCSRSPLQKEAASFEVVVLYTLEP